MGSRDQVKISQLDIRINALRNTVGSSCPISIFSYLGLYGLKCLHSLLINIKSLYDSSDKLVFTFCWASPWSHVTSCAASSFKGTARWAVLFTVSNTSVDRDLPHNHQTEAEMQMLSNKPSIKSSMFSIFHLFVQKLQSCGRIRLHRFQPDFDLIAAELRPTSDPLMNVSVGHRTTHNRNSTRQACQNFFCISCVVWHPDRCQGYVYRHWPIG